MARKNDQAESSPEVAERIRHAFDVLRLPHAKRRFADLMEHPEPETTRLEWVWSLLEPQVRARQESRVERRIRESKLPERKTFAAFDFDFQKTLDKDFVLELATLAFMREGRNILLSGWSGTGKSHIAKAIGLNACLENRPVRYTTSAAMLATLNASMADGTVNQAVKRYARPALLIIDEVGLEQVERLVATRAGLMQKVLLPRYEERRSTIITSNIDWSDWGRYLGDELGAAAILDRLIHHSHVIVIEGPSWRDHTHKKDVNDRRKRTAKKPKRPARDLATGEPEKDHGKSSPP